MEYKSRKSPRIPGYDYATPNYYFITICTHNKRCLFGEPGNLSSFGKIAEEFLLQIPKIYPAIKIDKYVVMPNHIHAIMIMEAEAPGQERKDLTGVIGQYKMAVTKQIRRLRNVESVWQRSFHDHVIRNETGYQKIWEYIHNNPAKWEDDCFYSEERN